jgi:hypothetical protein
MFTVAVLMIRVFLYRTDTDYDDALIAKLYIFMFVNSYAALFFVAFIKVSWLGAVCGLYVVEVWRCACNVLRSLFQAFSDLIVGWCGIYLGCLDNRYTNTEGALAFVVVCWI